VKRVIIVFGLVLIFCSCSNEKGLNGVWVGAYYDFSPEDSLSIKWPLSEVIQFSRGKYIIKKFLFDGDDSKGKYNYLIKKIYLDSISSLIVESFNKDSLVLKNMNLEKVYYKLHDSLKQNKPIEKLINRKFVLKIENLIDTISFVNDSLAIYNEISKAEKIYWEKVELENFHIILFDGVAPAVIIRNKKNEFKLVQRYKNHTSLINMIELK